LIVEILSPANANYDREDKLRLYQQAGVAEYWLVDYQAKTIQVYALVKGVYQLIGEYAGDDKVTSGQLVGFTFCIKLLMAEPISQIRPQVWLWAWAKARLRMTVRRSCQVMQVPSSRQADCSGTMTKPVAMASAGSGVTGQSSR
jgi:hypothetical protein